MMLDGISCFTQGHDDFKVYHVNRVIFLHILGIFLAFFSGPLVATFQRLILLVRELLPLSIPAF